jgi:hypothetical protein
MLKKGYNDLNTNIENTFATNGKIILSGAGRKSVYDGAGFLDEVKKGYNKTKIAVKSETGQKIVGALKEDKSVMKEFNKAKKQLKDYQEGIRKSPPGKLMLDILESQGVISKIEDEFKGGGNKSGKISRIKKANKWAQFSKGIVEDGMELGQKGLDMMNKQKDRQSPMGQLKTAFGGNLKRPQSHWIQHVKAFSQKNNISYKQALKEASPSYKAMKSKN